MKLPVKIVLLLTLFAFGCPNLTVGQDVLILANHIKMLEVAQDAVIKKYEHFQLQKEQLTLTQVTYQYVPAKVMAEELIEVVIDYQDPVSEKEEKFNEVVKVVVVKRRFVVIMGLKGYVKQVTDKTVTSYRVGDQ